MESIITDKSVEVQNLKHQIRYKQQNIEAIKSESVREAALLEGLRQQTAKVQTFVYTYKNNNEEYFEVIKSIEDKISDLLSNKRKFLKLAIISIIEAMRNNPEKYSTWSIIATIIKIHYHQSAKTTTAIYRTLADK